MSTVVTFTKYIADFGMSADVMADQHYFSGRFESCAAYVAACVSIYLGTMF
jgi:hypothetical protein